MSDALPTGWTPARIVQVIEDYQPGFASGEKNVEGGVAHLRMNNVGLDGELVLDLLRTVPEKLAKPRHDLRRGDVLVCTTNSAKLVGKCAFFDLPGRYAFSNHLTRLRPNDGLVDGRFLRWSLWLQWKSGAFDDQCKHWVNQSTLPKDALLESEMPLPPLAEQRRIVAKLETLLGKVDACQRRLAKIPRLLKRFRQSVLAAACSGRLTADWRAQNSASSAPPREKSGSRGGAENAEDFEGFPGSWEITKLGTLTSLVTSGSRGWAEYYADTGSVFIRAQDINSDFLNLDGIAHVELPNRTEGQRTKAQQHDILITITGANVTKSARVSEPLGDAYVSQHVALARLKDAQLSSFIFLCVISPAHGRKQLLEAAYGQGKPGLNLTNIRDLRIALPPLPEQHEIVRRVEQLFTFADQLEARFAKAHAHVDKLTQSLLAKAFRGELVPQDPNDEPASALLVRIRSETNGAEKPTRRKTKA